MDLKNRQIGFNSVVAACSSAGWDLVGDFFLQIHGFPPCVSGRSMATSSICLFQQHSCDTVGLSAALGPWKVGGRLVDDDMSDMNSSNVNLCRLHWHCYGDR